MKFKSLKKMEYTVKKGDTLWDIGRRFGTTVDAIMEANPWIKNRDHIEPGWVITIPI